MTSDAERLGEARAAVDDAQVVLKRAAHILDEVEDRRVFGFVYIEIVLAAHYAALLRAMSGRLEQLKEMLQGDNDGDVDVDQSYN